MKSQNLKTLAFILLVAFAWSCDGEQEDTNPQTPPDEEEEENSGFSSTVTVWDGATISFTKEAGANPNDEANQDRITENVWITRGNNGGQIYNASTESGANQDTSPAGTLWAVGSLPDIDNLTFRNFRAAVGNPKNVVGRNLVLYIPAEQLVMSVRFTAWSQNRQGGFAYVRSTE